MKGVAVGVCKGIHFLLSPCQHKGNPLVKMAAWMEEDDASELQDYLQGLQSRVKGGNVDWKMIMEGGSALVRDRTGARGLGGKSKRQVKGNEGGSRFLKGSSTGLKRKEENTYASVGSTMLPTNEFLKSHVMPQSPSDWSQQVSSFASSLLSDDQPSEREKQSLAPVASIARTSLHSDASVLESAEDTRSSIASDSAGPQSCRKEDTGSPCTPSTVAVDLPRLQFAADLTSSSSSVAPELVATANSVSEQLSTVVTEAVGDAPRSRQDGSQESGQEKEEDAGYRDDTFEDVSLLGDSDVECRTDNQEDQVEHDYGDSDFEESSAESSSRVSDEDEDEDDSRSDEERTSIEDQSSPKEASHSVVIPQSKSVPSAPPPTKVGQCTRALCVTCSYTYCTDFVHRCAD